MLDKLNIGSRLAIGFGVVIVASIAAFTVAALQGRQGQADIRESAQAAQTRIDTVFAMKEAQLRLVSAIRNAGLQSDGGQVNTEVEVYRKALQTLKDSEKSFAALPLDPRERELLDKASALRQQAEPVVDEAVKLAMAFAGEEAAKVLTGRFAPLQVSWAGELDALADLQRKNAASHADAITQKNDQRATLLAVLLFLVALGGALFAVMLTRSVTRPLQTAAALAERVAQGDLSVHIEASGNDEAAQLLRALQTMTVQLSTMVQEVNESSRAINAASGEISSGNLDLSNRTESTAASLEETSATLTELTEMVASNSTHANTVSDVAGHTASIAEQGGQAMGQVVNTMKLISDSSKRIADIIGVIDGIAFQTNILALNAAVEAARAGEQGRGFAVVASEVRALAQRVTSAASEVRTLISDSVTRVDDGARLVSGLGSTMQELIDGVSSVRQLIGEISSASSHQTDSIRQVNESVRNIGDTTQQNAALVEEVSAAAQSLTMQTERLGGLVNRFRVEDSHV
ncbi:MAG: chemotaxis sensory transducer [Comamonadaceae bacterium]|nr:MAG: chemotaxis sensory transducer [Comamonadaceae bacterium]